MYTFSKRANDEQIQALLNFYAAVIESYYQSALFATAARIETRFISHTPSTQTTTERAYFYTA